jgi:DNA-binding NarL/FixJ family response regulator
MSLEQEFLEEFGTFTFSDETPEQRGLGWSPADDPRDYRAEAHTLLEQEEDGLDAALIDIGLPDGDGLDLVRELNGHGERITSLPMLVRTANLEHSVAARAIEAGARGVLSKVVSMRETAEAVQRLIGAGRSAG